MSQCATSALCPAAPLRQCSATTTTVLYSNQYAPVRHFGVRPSPRAPAPMWRYSIIMRQCATLALRPCANVALQYAPLRHFGAAEGRPAG